MLQADLAAGWWVLQVQRGAELVATAALHSPGPADSPGTQAYLQVRQSCPAQPSPAQPCGFFRAPNCPLW